MIHILTKQPNANRSEREKKDEHDWFITQLPVMLLLSFESSWTHELGI